MDEGESKSETASPHAEYYGALLRLARDTMAQFLATGRIMSYHTANPWFLSTAAVFVTLRTRVAQEGAVSQSGELRGCIGQVEADAPLYEAVQDAAIKAAVSDPRFYPVEVEELDGLRIEISVLSPMRPIEDLAEILVGQDGLLIIGDRHRGLLLPEVPVMYGWDGETFVRALCRKAGLAEDAWPGRARLYGFTTESFEEG